MYHSGTIERPAKASWSDRDIRRRTRRSLWPYAGAWLLAVLITAPVRAQQGAPVVGSDQTGTRTTTDEIFAIKGWAGGTTDGGQQSFATSLGWSITPAMDGRYRYVYEFSKSRGPRLGTLGIELPSWCASTLSSCVDLTSLNASLLELPLATFSTTSSWFDFGTAQADGLALTMNPFSGLRLDFADFESGGGADGTGLATLTWRVSFDAWLAPVWGSFFASPLLTAEEGGGGSGGSGGNPGHGSGGEETEVEPSPTACLIDYGITPDPVTGETEIPGPPRAYNCGSYYRGALNNGGWVATPGAVVSEPAAPMLLVAGLLLMGGVALRRVHRQQAVGRAAG